MVDEVTISTGNLRFNGSIWVRGNVGSGVVIQSKDELIVEGLEPEDLCRPPFFLPFLAEPHDIQRSPALPSLAQNTRYFYSQSSHPPGWRLQSGQKIVIKKGVSGGGLAVIESAGDIHGKFFEGASLTANG